MCGILIHRDNFIPRFGIDHRGLESGMIHKNGYIFHHRSLPIQSINEDHIQPIEVSKGIYLLYNGEIFNYRKFGIFKSDLDYLKHFFKSGYNEKLLPEMNRWDGFWSIVIFDEVESRMIMFTDPLGKKQLYYSRQGICSEIKPLTMENHSLMLYGENCFGTFLTPFDGIYRIMPGNIYRMDISPFEERIPYVLKKNYFPLVVPTIKSDVYGMVDQAVKDRMVNKIDGITLFLSGGLDSTIILHHLLERGCTPELLSVANGKDTEYIKIVEKHYKVKTRFIDIKKTDYHDAINCYEHPLDYGSLLPQYTLCKAASNTVIFTGDGADELFGGYNRALKADTQKYDVFMELPFYHHIRLDRVSMAFTKELRQPFLSTDLIKYALSLPAFRQLDISGHSVLSSDRINKKILKDTYRGKLPSKILERQKVPLRLDQIKTNTVQTIFYESRTDAETFQPLGGGDARNTIKEGKRLQRLRRPPGKL